MTKTRAKYDIYEVAKEKMKELHPDELKTMNAKTFNKRFGMKMAVMQFGRARKQYFGIASGGEDLGEKDLYATIVVISKMAKKVGGLENLKKGISFIEKVRGL